MKLPSFPSRQNPAGRIVPGGRGSSWLAVFNWCSDLDWPLPPLPGDLVVPETFQELWSIHMLGLWVCVWSLPVCCICSFQRNVHSPSTRTANVCGLVLSRALFLPGLSKAGPALAVSTASLLSFRWPKHTSCPHDSWCVPSKRLFQSHVWFLIPAFLQPAPVLRGWSQKH